MHIHHIVPESEGGSGDYDNGIPVCLDCHAEIESKSNMGRRFTPGELKMHRDRWMVTVRDHPDVLVRSAQTLTETGPLEALFSEMEFNRTAILGGKDDPYPPLTVKQFERAIGTNALAALDEVTRDEIQRTYADIYLLNHHFEELLRMPRRDPLGDRFGATTNVRNDLRMKLQRSIPNAMFTLAKALDWDVFVPHTV
jgi:hypothetical protein